MMKTAKKLITIYKIRLFSLCILIALSINFQSCDELDNLTKPLSEEEVANGLKEALKVGIKNAVSQTNQEDGYFGNPLIKIPWPEEAQGAYNYIDNNLSTLKPYLSEVVLLMNRAAENASERAGPIFLGAITSMTFQDAWNILKGADNEATMYLHNRTYTSLHNEFRPDINNALDNVGVASIWTNLTTGYNVVANSFLFPNLDPINTDLADYTTTKALDGLFYLVSEEELKIRTDPKARVSEILERVFGELD